MKVILSALILLVLLGCNSAEKRKMEFEKIELGMIKSEVLEVAGPPFWSDRSNGMDRWIYYMEPDTKQIEKVVYFKEGRVFQKGVRQKPTLTAEEMEEVKKPRVKSTNVKPYERKYSDDELKKIIKKEIKKQKPKKSKKLEKI